MNIHSSFIHDKQKLETFQTFFNEWMDKQDTIDPQSRILLSKEKEQTIDMLPDGKLC